MKNVLVGEVWICSGQSNMAWRLAASRDPKLEALAANYPLIRMITLPRQASPEPKDNFESEWKICNPENAPEFSAVGYFFARTVHQAIQIPVGMINTSWGGTPSEAWTRPAVMKAEASLEPLFERWEARIKAWEDGSTKEKYQKALENWEEKVEEIKKKNNKLKGQRKKPLPLPRKPRAPSDETRHHHRPGNLYHGMIAPLIPVAFRGAIWYQGESNASRAHQYRTLFPMMIKNWRQDFGQGDFPFYWVQLANFRDKVDEPDDSDWAELREAQHGALSLPNTGEAVIIDLGQARDIHPKNKQDVGKRLARWALNKEYGQDVEISGPVYASHEIKGDKTVIQFDHAAGGLKFFDKQEGRGFAVAGENRKWAWAEAKIVGKDKVELKAESVKKPVAVRYNWAANPDGNLYNSAGLPTSPFRTDDWPGVTEENH